MEYTSDKHDTSVSSKHKSAGLVIPVLMEEALCIIAETILQ